MFFTRFAKCTPDQSFEQGWATLMMERATIFLHSLQRPHCISTVGQKPIISICHTKVAKIADLQAQNATRFELVDRLFLLLLLKIRGFCLTVTICNVALWRECGNIVALSIIKVAHPCCTYTFSDYDVLHCTVFALSLFFCHLKEPWAVFPHIWAFPKSC